MNALMRLARVFSPDEVKDNPDRVAPPLFDEVDTPRFVEFSEAQQLRLIDHWLSTKPNSDDILGDLFCEVDWPRLMPHIVARAYCEVGRQIALKLKELGDCIDDDEDYWRKQS